MFCGSRWNAKDSGIKNVICTGSYQKFCPFFTETMSNLRSRTKSGSDYAKTASCGCDRSLFIIIIKYQEAYFLFITKKEKMRIKEAYVQEGGTWAYVYLILFKMYVL